jgi:hypothetical protein
MSDITAMVHGGFLGAGAGGVGVGVGVGAPPSAGAAAACCCSGSAGAPGSDGCDGGSLTPHALASAAAASTARFTARLSRAGPARATSDPEPRPRHVLGSSKVIRIRCPGVNQL